MINRRSAPIRLPESAIASILKGTGSDIVKLLASYAQSHASLEFD